MAKPGEDEDVVDDDTDVVDEDVVDDDTDSTEDDDTGDDADKGKGKDEVAKLRREAAKYRRQLREAQAAGGKASKEAVAKVLKALGIDSPDDVTPEQLAEQNKTQADTLRQRTVELAVVRAAGKSGADPDALMDSRSFLDGLADLDPDDKDFAAQVADEIKAAVKRNPKLKGTAQVAGSSGGAHGSGSGTGSGGGKDKDDEDTEDAYKAVLKRNQRRRS
jgi:hypothetical protein